MVYNTESKTVRQVTDGSLWYSGAFNYEWSPDGKWFTLEIIGNGHDPYSDIAIVNADGKSQPVNITNSGYFNMMPHWVLDGNAILFMTDRYGMRSHASWGSLNDVMLVFLNQDAFDKYRLNKEDYELLKELEKEQANAKKAADERLTRKTKEKDKRRMRPKKKNQTTLKWNSTVLRTVSFVSLRILPTLPMPLSTRTAKRCSICRLSKAATTFGNMTFAKRKQAC